MLANSFKVCTNQKVLMCSNNIELHDFQTYDQNINLTVLY